MYLPPAIVDVRVDREESRKVVLWLPLFLLWPLLLLIVLPALLVSVVVDVALWATGARYHHFTMFILGCMKLLAETRGTHVRVVGPDGIVGIDIY